METTMPRSEGNPHAVRVLMYHRVVKEKELARAHWTCLHVDEFRRHIELLDRWGFTPITFNDYRFFLRGELNLPRKPVILTFDDGYLDTYETAYPLMEEYGVKAVVFVLGDQKVKTNFWDRHLNLPEAQLMQRHHIVELHEAGYEIGSHTLSHANLTMMPEDDVWEQISRSRILLEILLNAPVLSFSYPFGANSPMIKRMVSYAGYDIGCSVSTGSARFGDDSYETRRATIPSGLSALGFGARLFAPHQYYSWTRWKAGRLFHNDTGRRDPKNVYDLKETGWKQIESVRK